MTAHLSGRRVSKLALTSTLTVVLSLAAVLSGCEDPETRTNIDQQSEAARNSLNEAEHTTAPVRHYNPLVVSDKIWAGNTATRMHRGVPLPAKFETAHGVTVVSSEPMSLADVVADLSQQTGVPFHLADAGARSAGAVAAPAAPVGFGAPMSGTPASSGSGGGMPIAYEGPLSGLLERLSGHFGVNWHYDGSTIFINRFETRVFAVEALPGAQTVQDGMQDISTTSSSSSSSGGSSGSSGASSTPPTDSLTQSSKFSIDIKYWEELEKVVVSMLGGTGSVVVAPSLGSITVTTTPELMHVVADYISQENQRMSRQVAVNVEVYTVTLTHGLDFNVAFNTLLKRLTNFGANFAGASAPTTVSGFSGGGALSLAILNPNSISNLGNGSNFTHPDGQITDVFTALQGIGDTAKVAKFPLVTLNNRPVSRRIGTNIGYVQSSSTTTIGSALSSTPAVSLNPGTIQQGFSVQLTPRLLDDGRILLQYSLSIQDVLSIDTFNSVTGSSAASSASASATAGSSTIQLPTTSIRDFVQQSVLKSGSTLILGGAEEDDSSQNTQGTLAPDNYLLGGGISSGRSHTMVFFVLTPQVLDVPHSELE